MGMWKIIVLGLIGIAMLGWRIYVIFFSKEVRQSDDIDPDVHEQTFNF
jgi:hypothetical protein